MKYKGTLITQGSGSLAGATFSHNKGGQYIRQRTIPVNPNTTLQQAVRSIFATLSIAWVQTLTAAQRVLWKTYADNVPLINVLGDSIFITELAMYSRSNVPRLQAALTRVDDGPTTFSLAQMTNPSATAAAATDLLSVTFTNTDAWATAVGGAMLVYISKPQNPTINFFKGPYQFAGKIAGAVVPPTSPQTIALPQPIVAGQKVFFRIEATEVDGRLSLPFRGFAIGS